MPISWANQAQSNQHARAKAKAGFSLLEVLICIAVIGLVVVISLPNVPRTLESNADRRAAFHFERLALDLRATAFRDEQGLIVVDSGQFTDDPEADPRPAEIKLETGWTYALSGPLNISARGLCDPVSVDLLYEGRLRMRLQGATDCSFVWERVRS